MVSGLSRPSHDAALRENADRFLNTLLDAPAATRRPLLDALKTDDPELFALVDSLFAHFDDVDEVDGEGSGFLSQPLRPPPISRDDDAGDDVIGTRFGHWQVVKPIGRGGMGLVFEVERADGVVRQRAALKLIKRSFDNRSIVARFHTERQILAQLDHPSIARLIDAGASDDRPYLVMEYVDGVPLDRWCDDHALDIDARIELFNRICSAVHYAHQRLVVHRDLKPGNILITADGTPKLLDFGISKLIDADGGSAASAATIDASALLTPRYASPEQLTGAPISTASDVYSLGVLLFELLTGSGPYRPRNDTIIEMMRVVATEEATRVSLAASDEKLARRLRGDLDLIVAKALAREPGERYESVAALRDDLARHLDGDPIEAAPARWRYRTSKFVTKHRTAVAATSVVAVALAGLAIVASWEALRADRALSLADEQRSRAEQRFEDTRSLAKAMLFDVNDAIATGPTKAREQLVRTALTYLDRLSRDRLSPELQRDVASGYERIADILGHQGADNLGRPDEAVAFLEKALTIRQNLATSNPDDADNLTGLVHVLDSLGDLARNAARVEDAARRYAAATLVARKVMTLKPDDVDATLVFLKQRLLEARIAFTPGRPSLRRFADAKTRFDALIADAERYAIQHPGNPKLDDLRQSLFEELATLQWMNGTAADALVNARRDLALSEKEVAAQPDAPGSKRDLAVAARLVGDSLLQLGRTDEAMAMLQRSMSLRRDLAAADPTSARADRQLAIGHSMLGNAFELQDKPREALEHYEGWARHAEAALRRDPSNIGHRLDLTQARAEIAAMHLALGQDAVALSEARRVEADVLAFDAKTREQDAAIESLGNARMTAARSMAARTPSHDAFVLARSGVGTLEELTTRTPEDSFVARDAARARVEAGEIGIADGVDRAEGCGLVIRGLEQFAALQAEHRLSAQLLPFVEKTRRGVARCHG